MKISEVNESLIGKKVYCVFTGLKITGYITRIFEDEYSKGVEIAFSRPVNWGGEWYYSDIFTGNKMGENFGCNSLKNVELLSEDKYTWELFDEKYRSLGFFETNSMEAKEINDTLFELPSKLWENFVNYKLVKAPEKELA